MKKYFILSAGLCAAVAFTSCKSQQSDYRKVYEKAQAEEQAKSEAAAQQESAPVVTPLVTQPATTPKVSENVDNVSVSQESVTLVSGSGLKDYSVVVGSFGLKANALGLQNTLKAAGYDAQVAYNESKNMYRVVATSYTQKSDAVSSRNQLRQKYPDAWLLYKK